MFAFSGLMTLALTLAVGDLPPAQLQSHPGDSPTAAEPNQFSYEVRFIECSDLNWRSAVASPLQEVSRRGTASVYTFDDHVIRAMFKHLVTDPRSNIIQAPKVTALEGAEATIADITQRQFVTGVRWISQEGLAEGQAFSAQPQIENVEIGHRVQVSGRRIDQGTLLKVDFQDKQIVAIHKATSRPDDDQDSKIQSTYQVPELQEMKVQGEWLVPNDHSLLLSFGPRTVTASAGKDKNKPAIRECLVLITPRAIVKEVEERVAITKLPKMPQVAPPAPMAPLYLPPAPEGISATPVPQPSPMPSPGMPTVGPVDFGSIAPMSMMPMSMPMALMTPEGPIQVLIYQDDFGFPMPGPGVMAPMMGPAMSPYGFPPPQPYPYYIPPQPYMMPGQGGPIPAGMMGMGPIVPDLNVNPQIPAPVLPALPSEEAAPPAPRISTVSRTAAESAPEAEVEEDGPMPNLPARTLPMGFTPEGKPAPPPPLPDEDTKPASMESPDSASTEPLPSPQTRQAPAIQLAQPAEPRRSMADLDVSEEAAPKSRGSVEIVKINPVRESTKAQASPQSRPSELAPDRPKVYADFHVTGDPPRPQGRQIPQPTLVQNSVPGAVAPACDPVAHQVTQGSICCESGSKIPQAEALESKIRGAGDLIQALNETLDRFYQEHPEAVSDPFLLRMQFQTGPAGTTESFQVEAGRGIRIFDVEMQHLPIRDSATRPASHSETAACCDVDKTHPPGEKAESQVQVHPASNHQEKPPAQQKTKAECCEDCPDLSKNENENENENGEQAALSSSKPKVIDFTSSIMLGRLSNRFRVSADGIERAEGPILLNIQRETSRTSPKCEDLKSCETANTVANQENWPLTLADSVRIGLENSERFRVVRLGLGICDHIQDSKAQAYSLDQTVITEIEAVDPACDSENEVADLIRKIERSYWSLAEQEVQYWSRLQAVKLAQSVFDRESKSPGAGNGGLSQVAEFKESLNKFQLDLTQVTTERIKAELQLRNVLGLKPTDGRRIIPSTSLDIKELKIDQQKILSNLSQSHETKKKHVYLTYTEKAREAAERRLEAQRSFFEKGTINSNRYLDAINNWAGANTREAQSKAAYNIALMAMEDCPRTSFERYGIAMKSGNSKLEPQPSANSPKVDPETTRTDFVPSTTTEAEAEEQAEAEAAEDVTEAVEASVSSLSRAFKVGREAVRFAQDAAKAAEEVESTFRFALVASQGLAKAFGKETNADGKGASGFVVTPEMVTLGLSLADSLMRQFDGRAAGPDGSKASFEVRIPFGEGSIEFRAGAPR